MHTPTHTNKLTSLQGFLQGSESEWHARNLHVDFITKRGLLVCTTEHCSVLEAHSSWTHEVRADEGIIGGCRYCQQQPGEWGTVAALVVSLLVSQEPWGSAEPTSSGPQGWRSEPTCPSQQPAAGCGGAQQDGDVLLGCWASLPACRQFEQ